MINRIFLILGLCFFMVQTNAATDYSRLFIGQLLELGEVILVGEIIEVGDSTILVEVEHLLKGEIKEECILIRQFRDWTCAYRWSKYKTGQKGVYCLRRFGSALFEVVGGGNEGEFPIFHDNIYFLTHISGNMYPELGNYHGYKFNDEEAVTGITEYLDYGLDFQQIRFEDNLLEYVALIENKLLQKIAAWKIAANYDDLGLTFEHRVYLTREYIMK